MKARSFKVYERGQLMKACSLISSLLVSEEHPLLIEVADFKEPKTRQQEKLYHAILGDVAEQVAVGGLKFAPEAWKEHYCRKFLPLVEVVLPTGEIIQRRTSTTKLNIEEYSELIDKTLADLASEFGYLPEELAA